MRVEVEKITTIELAKEVIEFSKRNFQSKLTTLRKLYASEHSPMYSQIYILRLYDIPYWVHVHIRTHKKHFICEAATSSRPDLTGKPRDPNGTVNMIIICNAKTIIDMMLKRLCAKTSIETMDVFLQIKRELRKQQDELFMFCVPKCIRNNGLCGEFVSCGYINTNAYFLEQTDYNTNFKTRTDE